MSRKILIAVGLLLVVTLATAVALIPRKPKPPPRGLGELEYLALQVPGEAMVENRDFEVWVQVKATETGNYTVRAEINGEVIEEEVYLEAGVENTVYLDVSGKLHGSYRVKAGNFNKPVEVREAEPPQFEILDLLVIEEATVEETIEIKVRVRNVGEMEGTYVARLSVKGEVLLEKEVEESIPPRGDVRGNVREIRFLLRPNELADLLGEAPERPIYVTIEDKRKPFDLRRPRPAELEPIALGVPSVGYEGRTVKIVASVKNVGDKENELTIELKIVGVKNLTKGKRFKAGEEYTHTFTYSFPETGEYTLKLGELTETISIKTEPDVRVTELEVVKCAYVGEEISVGAKIKNFGRREETYSIVFKASLGGTTVKSKPASGVLDAGKETTEWFTFSGNEKGKYSVSVGAEVEMVEVITGEESCHVNDKWTYKSEYLYEVPVIGYRKEGDYTFDSIYEGIEDFGGLKCLKFRFQNVKVAESYSIIHAHMTSDYELQAFHMEQWEEGELYQSTSFDPPLPCWKYPPPGFIKGGPVNMTIEVPSAGWTITGKATMEVSVGAPGIFMVEAGSFKATEVVLEMRITGEILISGMRGDFDGTLIITRYLADLGTIKEDIDLSGKFNVKGISGTVTGEQSTELKSYKVYREARCFQPINIVVYV